MKTTFGELASAVGKVTPIASSLGITTNELFSSLASTTAQGLATTESVTALKAAMSNIIKPSAEATKAAEALGISFNVSTLQTKGWMPFLKELKEQLKGASPEYAALAQRNDELGLKMNKLRAAGQENTKEFRALSKQHKNVEKDMKLLAQAADSPIGAFATMFGSVEGLNSILMLTSENGMNLYNESMRQMTESTGALDDAYEKMSETTETKFARALNKGKNSLMELGVKALPLFEKGIDFLSGLIDKFNNLSPSTQEWVLKIGLASAALGPFLSLTGGTIKGIGELVKLAPKVSTFFGLFKGASAVGGAATAIGEVGTAASAAAGGFSLFGAAAKLGALALNPWVLGAAAVGVAGYGIYKVLDQEVVPKMDLFEDAVISSTGAMNGIVDSSGHVNSSLSMMGNSMGEYGEIASSTVVKISEGTKKAVGAYMKLDKDTSTSLYNLRVNSTKTADQVKVDMVKKFNETSSLCSDVSQEMKEKINKEFIDIYAGSSGMTEQMKNDMSVKMKEMLDNSKLLSEEQKNKIVSEYEAMYNDSGLITEQMKNDLTTKYNEMGQQIKDGLKTKQDESMKDMQDYFFKSNALTVEEEAKIMQAEKDSWEGRKGAIDVYTKEMNEIVAKAHREHRIMNDEEFKRINELKGLMKTEAVKALSETEIESKVILERIKSNSERLTADQASDTVKKANETRDKAVKAAEEEYDKRVGWIIKQRDETGKLTAEQADKLIKEAERTKKDSIQKANDMCEGIKTEIEKGSPGIWEKVDKQNGGIIRGYTKLKNEVVGFFSWLFKSVGEGANALENLGKDTPSGKIPGHAIGTSFFNGGLTWINEDGKELIELPSNGARLANLPRGTKIFNASDSANMKKRMMKTSNKEAEMKAYDEKIEILNSSSKDVDKHTSSSTDELKKQLDADIKSLKDALYNLQQEEEKALRDVRGKNKQALRDSVKDEYETKKKSVKDQIELKKEETEAKIEEIKKAGKATKEQLETEKEQLKEKQDILKKELEARKLFAKNVNDLSSNIVNALKEKYSQEAKIKEEAIQEEISSLEKLKESELRNLEETYTAKKESLDLMAKEAEESIHDEMDRWSKWKDNAVKNIENTYDFKKRSLEEAERVSEKIFDAESNRIDKWKESQLDSIDEVSSAKIKSLQSQIDALEDKSKTDDRAEKDREELAKINKLKEQIPYEHNDFNKAELQKEIARLEAERTKRLNKEAIDDKKENLKKQIDSIKEDVDKQKEKIKVLYDFRKEDLKKRIEDTKEHYRLKKQQLDDSKKYELQSINDMYKRNKEMLDRKLKDSKAYYESEKKALERSYKENKAELEARYKENKALLENELKDVKKFYEDKTKEAKLQAEAEKLIMNKNQKEIVALLNSYGKEYKATGQTLGERLVEGFKPAIQDIKGLMNSVSYEISQARDNALRSMKSYEDNKNSNNYNGQGSQVTNQYSVNIVSPVAQTPSQQRREMETTLRRLSYSS